MLLVVIGLYLLNLNWRIRDIDVELIGTRLTMKSTGVIRSTTPTTHVLYNLMVGTQAMRRSRGGISVLVPLDVCLIDK